MWRCISVESLPKLPWKLFCRSQPRSSLLPSGHSGLDTTTKDGPVWKDQPSCSGKLVSLPGMSPRSWEATPVASVFFKVQKHRQRACWVTEVSEKAVPGGQLQGDVSTFLSTFAAMNLVGSEHQHLLPICRGSVHAVSRCGLGTQCWGPGNYWIRAEWVRERLLCEANYSLGSIFTHFSYPGVLTFVKSIF